MLFDDILIRIGHYGLYQKRILFLATLVAIPVAFNNVASVFLAASMDHWCTVPDDGMINCGGPLAERNTTFCESIKRNNIPRDKEDDNKYQQCRRYSVSYDTQLYDPSSSNNISLSEEDTIQCDKGWQYDTTQYESSIVSEFDLVCDSETLVSYASSIYFAGVLLGSLANGMIADWIGRFPTFIICVFMTTIFGIATSFAQSYTAFVTLRFFVAVFNIGMYLMVFIIGTEIVGPSKRIISGILIAAHFGLGVSIYAVLAYFFRDWRTLQLVISVPTLVFLLLIIIMHESSRWLISRGKYDKAEQIIRKIASVNGREVPEELLERKKEKDEKGSEVETALKTYTQLDLFRTPVMRKKTLIILFNWFVINMVYYGLSLSTSSLGVDDYAACFISGAVEIPAVLGSWFVIQKFGRRTPHCIFMIIGGVACLITTLLPLGVARTAVAMVGKFGLTAGFCIIYIYSGEIYPTVVRSIGMGVSSMSARVSGVLSPIILLLQKYWTPLPLIVFGCSSIVAGLLTLMLPETRKQPLPETLQDGETFKDGAKLELPSCIKNNGEETIDNKGAEADNQKVDIKNNVV